MPASKKDLRKLQQKQNVANGVGDEKGRIASNNKVINISRFSVFIQYMSGYSNFQLSV